MSTWSDTVSGLSPVHWWRLSETSGNYADSGSAGNASTSVGGGVTRGSTSLVPNDPDKAATFATNNSGSVIQFGNLAEPAGSYTVILVFKFTDTTFTAGYRRVYFAGVGLDFTLAKSSETPANALTVDHYGSGGSNWSCSTAALSANTVYSALAVYSDADDTIKMYVNGAQSGSTTTGVTQNVKSTTNGHAIGNNATAAAGTAFGGVIDDVAVFDSALSSNDVAALWSAFNAKLTSAQQSVSRQAVTRAATR